MYFLKAKESAGKWWHYLVMIFIVAGAQLIGLLPLLMVIALKQRSGEANTSNLLQTLNFESIGINQNIGLILLLLPSVLSFFVLLFSIKAIHRRKIGDIASASGNIRWERFFYGLTVWLLLLIAVEFVASLIHKGNYSWQFSAAEFLPLLIVCLLMVPFQAAFEELLFRSYLMQGIGLLFRLRFVALILTSIGFGLIHKQNPEVSAFGFWNTMPFYVGFGLFAGLLVVMDNGIEMAIGVHAVNNLYGAVLVNYQASVLKTSALIQMKKLDPLVTNIGFVVIASFFLLIAAKKYQWKNWGKIFTRISN